MSPGLRRACLGGLGLALVAGLALYLAIWIFVGRDARERLERPPQRPADAALVLGNRAYRDGRPNPCLTGRVDAALALARARTVRPLLLLSGGATGRTAASRPT